MNDIDKAIEELESLEEVEIVKLAEGAEMQTQDVSNKIESGFKHIDSCIDGGFREGDFNIITGIPGEGKTTLSRMFTLNFAKQEVPTLWFSYEMTLK
jgi:replicative DNA helicase